MVKKILLIDDDKDVAHLTQKALVINGYQVAVFHDAVQGIENARQEVPDLILMDVMLPGVGGEDAVKMLKEDPRLKSVPVVFLTSLISGDQDALENTELTIDGLKYRALGKPFEIERLLKIVRAFVR